MQINSEIKKLVQYGLENNLIEKEDEIFTTNRLLETLCIEDFDDKKEDFSEINLEEILKNLLDYAVEKKLIENTIIHRDLFDTKLMSCLVARPSEIVKKFENFYKKSPKIATDWYYNFSQNTDYIRRYRITKDIKWKCETEYGILDLTINLSKPEKDPVAIALAKNSPQSSYPKCALCYENEGYAGRLNHPARQNHRIIPVTIQNEQWGFQYSPYVYYNEHCIVFNKKHVPMKIDKNTFEKLFDFIKIFPHYFVGSNADLPVVGGSILAHDHFQGGNYEFAMARAEIEKYFTIKGYEDVETGILKWPMSVIRLRHKDEKILTNFADLILQKWRNYTDKNSFIFAETNGEPHNTITPIARIKNDKFELDLVLRNNITTDEHPLGVFHPHANLHHIKKENIGLIEVMGLAVLPARLKNEIEELKNYILNNLDINSNENIKKHAHWIKKLREKYDFNSENIDEIFRNEIGKIFVEILKDAGVFKRDEQGQNAFEKFIFSLNK